MALALFDLDDTLLNGDSATLWFHFMVTKGVASQAMLAKEEQMMAYYYAGQLDMAEYMAFTLQPLAGRSVHEVMTWVQEFVNSTISQRFFTEGLASIAKHRAQGDRIVIVSASGEHIVKPIAALLGVTDVLAIELEEKAGIYTGETKGVLSFREGKVSRLKSWIEQEHETLVGSCGYSDSINDQPMLTLVEQANVINPADALLALAQKQGWSILDWRQTGSSSSQAAKAPYTTEQT